MVIMGGQATPAPPVGSSLGQHGVNMMDFINPFNEQTQDRKGQPTPVLVTIYEDKSMSFVIKGTPAKVLIKELIKIGSIFFCRISFKESIKNCRFFFSGICKLQ